MQKANKLRFLGFRNTGIGNHFTYILQVPGTSSGSGAELDPNIFPSRIRIQTVFITDPGF
jgi:hypothetical protein